MATSLTISPPFARPNFRGLTDKYANYSSRFGLTKTDLIQKAIRGEAPFDPVSGLIDVNYRDTAVERLTRYRWNWRWYNGDHYDNPFEEGELKSRMNYCKLIVDKTASFFSAQGWSCKTAEGNELVADALNTCWEKNNRDVFTETILQFGGITGDSYGLAMIATSDKANRPLKRKDWYVSIMAVDPKYVFPFFSPSDPNVLEAALIQYPAASQDVNSNETILFSLFITPETLTVYNNDVQISEVPNPFGRVNLVKCRNKIVANSSFGDSDLDDIIPLNEEYNITSNSVRRVVKYHGEPTTIVYGARVSDMEKGAKKVWSNLPENAKVENLKMEGDLDASNTRVEFLEQRILVMGELPKVALDLEQAPKISNASGIAIAMLWQPLIDKINRKRKTVTPFLQELNELIIIGMEALGTDFQSLADNTDRLYDSEIEYTSSLPKDRGAEIDIGIKMVEQGAWSLAEFIRQLSGVTDLERLSVELAADAAATLLLSYEEQRAVLGKRPSIIPALLGSPSLSQDLKSWAAQIAKVMQKSLPTKVPVLPPAPKNNGVTKPKTVQKKTTIKKTPVSKTTTSKTTVTSQNAKPKTRVRTRK